MSGQLVSRQAGTATMGSGVHPAHPAQAGAAMTLSEIERVCNMIATGGDLVPACYRNKPGAVYLTLMWARKHNVDELTAVQNIVPINGKPFVQAELHREVMEGRGYRVELVESTNDRCEVEISDPRGRVRRVVAALPDAIEERGEGLIFVQPGAEFKSNALWTTRRSDMLFALAIRIADRRIVGSGAAGVDAAQDYQTEPGDVLDVLAPQPVPEQEPVDDDLASVDGVAERLAHLAASAAVVDLKDATVLKEANRLAREASGAPVATLADLAQPGRADLYDAVLDWIGGH